MGALGWRRGGGGGGVDGRGGESESESESESEELVAPTQAALGPADVSGGGLFSRVGGWIGLGRTAQKEKAVRRSSAAVSGDDDDDDGIATTSSARAARKRLRSAESPSSPRDRSDARGSPRGLLTKRGTKRKRVPIGSANRHSKRAAIEANVPSIPRKKRVMWTVEETAALEDGVRTCVEEGRFDFGVAVDEDKQVNDKWRRILEQHRAVFDVNGRTTMDLKDKWRNIVGKRERDARIRAEVEGGGGDAATDPGDGEEGQSPTSWRRAMIRLGLARAPPDIARNDAPLGSSSPPVVPLKPRVPGVSNRHSAYRKKLGLTDGRRKRAQPWDDREVEALEKSVEEHGEGKWAVILKANLDVFFDRSAVDLKDKWRNLKGRATRKPAPRRVNGEDAPVRDADAARAPATPKYLAAADAHLDADALELVAPTQIVPDEEEPPLDEGGGEENSPPVNVQEE
jgi:hypothetical protein